MEQLLVENLKKSGNQFLTVKEWNPSRMTIVEITAILLENQEKALEKKKRYSLVLTLSLTPTVHSTAVAGFDPVLISLVRRAMPNLIAYDICGVQPMSGPTGLIFAMKAKCWKLVVQCRSTL